MDNWLFERTCSALVRLGVLQSSGRCLQCIHCSINGLGSEASGRVDFRLHLNVYRLGYRHRNVCFRMLRSPEDISGFGFFHTKKNQGAIRVFQLKKRLKPFGYPWHSAGPMRAAIGPTEVPAVHTCRASANPPSKPVGRRRSAGSVNRECQCVVVPAAGPVPG